VNPQKPHASEASQKSSENPKTTDDSVKTQTPEGIDLNNTMALKLAWSIMLECERKYHGLRSLGVVMVIKNLYEDKIKARESVTGQIPCPWCRRTSTPGTIRFGIAGSNGHTHGSCTNGCVSWME
jgi:hypothetical protein